MPHVSAPQTTDDDNAHPLGRLASAAGYVLAISYPLLALSIGVRALYQLLGRPDIVDKTGPMLSLVAATLYAIAAVGFARRTRRAWYVSVSALSVEMVMVLLVGTITVLRPDLIQHSAWRMYGLDYGLFPLVQPFLGLLWLLWPTTRVAYGIGPKPGMPREVAP